MSQQPSPDSASLWRHLMVAWLANGALGRRELTLPLAATLSQTPSTTISSERAASQRMERTGA